MIEEIIRDLFFTKFNELFANHSHLEITRTRNCATTQYNGVLGWTDVTDHTTGTIYNFVICLRHQIGRLNPNQLELSCYISKSPCKNRAIRVSFNLEDPNSLEKATKWCETMKSMMETPC